MNFYYFHTLTYEFTFLLNRNSEEDSQMFLQGIRAKKTSDEELNFDFQSRKSISIEGGSIKGFFHNKSKKSTFMLPNISMSDAN